MLRASVTFFVIGLLAFVIGAYNLAGISIEIGKILLAVFLLLALITFVLNFILGKTNKF
jgi:uncharacterized membrane protein YtjA (UPF0391 family)